MIPTMISGSSVRYKAPLSVRKVVIRSPRKNVDAREVSLISVTNSLPRAGRIFLSAWGRITFFIAWDVFNPRLLAASIWPGSTAWIPALMISDT